MSQSAAAILAVDDNLIVRKALTMRLEAKGFEVVTAADGDEALTLVARRPFDLVLLDLRLPGVRGDEVLRRLREQHSATELPVIMLAASSELSDINHALELGANDYIVKPGDLPLLVTRIRTQLTLRDTVRNLRAHSARLRETRNGTVTTLARLPATPPQGLPHATLHAQLPVSCLVLAADGTLLDANLEASQIHGYRPGELAGQALDALYEEADRACVRAHLEAVLAAPGDTHRWDVRHRRKDGSALWMRDTARTLRDGPRWLVQLCCEDIDDLRKLDALVQFRSRHDELTGLANRKTLEERLERVIDSARSEGTEHALLQIDIDQFKVINNSYGHAAGDDMLRQVARVLRGMTRSRDTLARMGSDAFALLVEDCGPALASTAAELVRREIEAQEFTWAERRSKLTASIGVVGIDRQIDAVGRALNLADLACDAVKVAGGNAVRLYRHDSAPLAARRGELDWAARLGDALATDRFVLTAQPIAPLAAAAAAGTHYEILLRMIGEDGTWVLPGEFLPAAERYHLATRIDRWVISEVFDWLEREPRARASLGLCSINLSAQSIGQTAMFDFIRARLQRGIVSPHKICFELTETAAITDLVQASRFMQRLQVLGCRFALDDFGSGFSSLTYLRQLPIDFLKIDGAFVRDIVRNATDRAMVRSINDIGHVMGKQTIAEFVEDSATLEQLRRIGVDYVQGHAIGHPVPLASLVPVGSA